MACSDLCRSAVNELRVLTLSLLCVAGEMEDRWRRRVEREREREILCWLFFTHDESLREGFTNKGKEDSYKAVRVCTI